MRGTCLSALALLVMPPSTAAQDGLISITADQTTYIAVCDFCTPAEVNWANPLIVRETSDADIRAYLAFELPTAPADTRLESAELMVLQGRDDHHPYAWAPLVALNYSESDLDLTWLIGPDVPLPESPIAPFLESTPEARDPWDVSELIGPLLGERVLFVLTPPPGAADRSRYQFEGVRPDGVYNAQPFLLLEFIDEGTPAEASSFGKIKGLFEEAGR